MLLKGTINVGMRRLGYVDVRSAGKRILEEEGNNRLAPSSAIVSLWNAMDIVIRLV